jgi:hypothetical protein
MLCVLCCGLWVVCFVLCVVCCALWGVGCVLCVVCCGLYFVCCVCDELLVLLVVSVLFCYVMLCSALFYSVLLCTVLSCSVLLCSFLFCSVLLCDVSAVCYVVLCISLCGVWCGVVPVGEISFYIHAPTKALAICFLACLVLSCHTTGFL